MLKTIKRIKWKNRYGFYTVRSGYLLGRQGRTVKSVLWNKGQQIYPIQQRSRDTGGI
ncbi:MAG: hypothetical protein K2M78_14480 [Lachnospiraceae bacterium]|nr:hypothetical protein [Lachnospiraceae bacterium]